MTGGGGDGDVAVSVAELRDIAVELMTALEMLDGMIASAPPERRAPSPRSVHARVTEALANVRELLERADAR